ncbi:MAG: chorismate mutase [Clostridiales bacterium]|nr:chorismate mutase [Clostridiales bacterium]
MRERTIRGAITSANTKEAILKDTKTMLTAMLAANDIQIKDITAVLFTATQDLTKVYPAVAARELGIVHASLMCIQEMAVEGSLEKCLRCMMTVQSEKKQAEMRHIYLNDAVKLRPDLTKTL